MYDHEVNADEPATPSPGQISREQLIFLTVGLVLFVVLGVAPFVLGLWLIGSLVGTVGIAEALEHTRGLAPDTYFRGFVAASLLTAGMVALELRAIFTKRAGHLIWRLLMRPSVALLFVISVTVNLVVIDIDGTDIPDSLTTTLLLLCAGYVYFILPLGLAEVSSRLTRWMWRAGNRSGFGAGALGTLALTVASCIPVYQCGADESEPDDSPEFFEHIEDGFEKSDGRGLIEGSREVMTALSEVIPNEEEHQRPSQPPRQWPTNGNKGRFDSCIEELFEPRNGRSPRVESIDYFLRKGDPLPAVEDIVQATILEICLTHAKTPHKNLLTRFRTKMHQRRINVWDKTQRRSRRNCDIQDVVYGPGSGLTHDESMALERAICSLNDPRDQKILWLTAEGYEALEIGSMVVPPLTAVAVRQRKNRAIKRLHTILH